ncbi:MAG: hypothetical protein BMS9Abin20_1131 [Acidimicrobiia bacterium]|nr:MAG: hypothetical protein BMS9Abin20_1131 [Acidimicrobiia bacterium]
MRLTLMVAVLTLVAAACSPVFDGSGPDEPDPSAANLVAPGSEGTEDREPRGVVSGAEVLVADLKALGVVVEDTGSFSTIFLGGRGLTYCIDGQQINVWEYPSQDDRKAASRLIDRNDPSSIGNSMVEWRGDPTFWQRDTILVLYLGKQAATLNVLNELLGPAFAEGRGRSSPDSGDCVYTKRVNEQKDPPQEAAGFSLFYSQRDALYTEGSATGWDLISVGGVVTAGATLGPTEAEELFFIELEPGTYTIRSWQRPCPGYCGEVLESPTDVCAARFTVEPGETVEAEVTVRPGLGCAFEFEGIDEASVVDPSDYGRLSITFPEVTSD